MLQRIIVTLFFPAVVFGVGYLLTAPVPIEPAAWLPPTPPRATGLYRPNRALERIERVGEGLGFGPEDVAIDRQGRIYTGVEDGTIVRLAPNGSGAETFATTGGRPLGLDFDSRGHLIVADAYAGLLRVSPDGEVSVLATEQGGLPFALTNDVDVAADGTIYFSDSSHRFPLSQFRLDLLEHRPNGRLLAFDPETGETRLVLDSLYFANGVAVSADQQSVFVVETGKYRVRRVAVAGAGAGTSEVVLENLPGFPDNISSAGSGFWLALVAPRDPNVDDSLLPSPFLRRMLLRLPPSFLPEPGNFGYVVRLDSDGDVSSTLQDLRGGFRQITSAVQGGGWLYFGSLAESAVGRMPVP
jgi:sugar lactone lactonase YvrE